MNFENPVIFVNGQRQSHLSVCDRAVNYGHGVFETLRLCHHCCPLWDYHLNRLQRGASVLGIALKMDVLLAHWKTFLEAVPGEGIVKLVVTAGEGARGYRADPATQANYLLQWTPLSDAYIKENQEWGRNGVAVKSCQYRLPLNPSLAGIKHLNRLDQVLASRELDSRHYQEGLLLDVTGNIIEGLARNIFLKVGGQWLTPDLTSAGIAGVMRQYLLENAFSQLALQVTVDAIPFGRLNEVEEAVMCNSVGGIWPVVAIDKHCFEIGVQTRALQRQLRQALPCFGM